MAVLKLSVRVKKIHETAERTMKKPISHRFKVVHTPSSVRRGAKMVKARMVAVGKRTLRRAVPFRMALMIYK